MWTPSRFEVSNFSLLMAKEWDRFRENGQEELSEKFPDICPKES
ncbi:hypothetical protein LEP1GSC052_0821 [Leptospira kmetyi serovar Malaysia str. Bejo-Iso9]|nr:hypothetical protein LEP1GSC052_0821 [Leptospira kmetyi serovar Malaysia str. Bejo-Iso9]